MRDLKELDRLCRAVVFERDGNCCMRCGKTDHLQWAHVYSRRYRALRWLPLNSMCLCAGCHLAWHHRPLEAMKWWTEKVGAEKAAMLEMAAKSRDNRPLDAMALKLHLQQGVA